MEEKRISRIEFWPYDIFGYLLPGLIASAALICCNSSLQRLCSTLVKDNEFYVAIAIAISAYLIGHLIAALSSLFLERIIVRHTMKYPTERMFDRSKAGTRKAWFYTSYSRPYSKEFIDLVDRKFMEVYGVIPSDVHDRFWMAWSYITLHHPPAFRRSTHFLELYGFARNSSMSLLISAFYPVLFHSSWNADISPLAWVIVLSASSLVMFMNYLKLLRRDNDEIFRGFVACDSVKKF